MMSFGTLQPLGDLYHRIEPARRARAANRWWTAGSAMLGAALLLVSLHTREASAQEGFEAYCEAWDKHPEILMRVSGALASVHARFCGPSAGVSPSVPASEYDVLPFIARNDRLVNDPGADGLLNSTQSETSIAQDGARLCAAWNDSGSATGFSGFGWSANLGRTWTDGGAFPNGTFNAQPDTNFGDPSLAYSKRDHAFYYAALSSAGLSLWRSVDRCLSFQYVGPIHLGQMDDKELMAIDNNPFSPDYGRIYVGWTNFSLFPGDVEQVTHSDNGGSTWSTPETLVGSGPDAQGMWPAVAPNGDVYFAFLDRCFSIGCLQDQRIYRSQNGGDTWFEVTPIAQNQLVPENAASTIACGRQALNGNIRNLSSPQIAIHTSPAAPAGYVLHAVYPYDSDGAGPDNSNVFYRRSVDGGFTWSQEVQLNDDSTNTDQFFPAIGVNDFGAVVVSWYDRRLDPANLLFDRFAVVSLDGGLSWGPNVRVSDVSSPVSVNLPHFDGFNPCYHGDYDQLTVDLLGANIIWSDDRRVTAAGPNPDIFFDRLSLLFPLSSASKVDNAGVLAGGSQTGSAIDTEAEDESRKTIEEEATAAQGALTEDRSPDRSCTSDGQCPSGYQCWAERPAGPGAGKKGSPANPGKCVDERIIIRIQ